MAAVLEHTRAGKAGYDGVQLDPQSLEIYAHFLGELDPVETDNKFLAAMMNLGVKLLELCMNLAWSLFASQAKRTGALRDASRTSSLR